MYTLAGKVGILRTDLQKMLVYITAICTQSWYIKTSIPAIPLRDHYIFKYDIPCCY